MTPVSFSLPPRRVRLTMPPRPHRERAEPRMPRPMIGLVYGAALAVPLWVVIVALLRLF